MADTTVPKAMAELAIASKTKELKGTEKRDTLIEIEKVGFFWLIVSKKHLIVTIVLTLAFCIIEISAKMGGGEGLRGRRPLNVRVSP